MSKLHSQVREFHERYEQPIGDKPAMLSLKRLELRLALIGEEFCELLEACGCDEDDVEQLRFFLEEAIDYVDPDLADLPGICDALGDLDYVVEGFRLELGVDGEPVADEIHRANFSKLGADGKPVRREDGKIIKGPNYSPPDIEGELRKQGWDVD